MRTTLLRTSPSLPERLYNDLRSLAFYFFQQLSAEHEPLWQESTSELLGQFHSDDLRFELVRNLWHQEVSDARDQQWRSRP